MDEPTERLASPPAPEAPAVVGSYRLEDRLGAGGQAAVYRARQTTLDRVVAVKLLHARLSADPELTERFHREARLVARLSHPNIVTVHESGVHEGWHWLAMEYVEGDSLAALLAREGPLDPARAVAIARDVALALAAASSAGILHRDVKPANVLLTRDGQPKLADLGMAKDSFASQSITASGAAVGTPRYMSPEQGMGEADVDAQTDIYALGLTLFEMLTGQVPLQGHTAMATIIRHAQEDVPSLRSLLPGAPPALERVVARMTARDRDRRYRDPAAVADDLAAALDGAEAALPEPPPTATSPAPVRAASAGHRGLPAWLLALAVPLVLGAIAFGVTAVVGALRDGADASAPAPAPASAPAPALPPPPRGPTADEIARAHAAIEALARDAHDLAGALAELRRLGIGPDLARFAKTVAELPAAARREMWFWVAIDRAVAGDGVGVRLALDRHRAELERDQAPVRRPRDRADRAAGSIATTVTRVLVEERLLAFVVACLEGDPERAERALDDPVGFAVDRWVEQSLGMSGREALRSLLGEGEIATLLPLARAGAAARADAPDRAAIDADLAAARAHVDRCERELRDRVERRIAELEAR